MNFIKMKFKIHDTWEPETNRIWLLFCIKWKDEIIFCFVVKKKRRKKYPVSSYGWMNFWVRCPHRAHTNSSSLKIKSWPRFRSEDQKNESDNQKYLVLNGRTFFSQWKKKTREKIQHTLQSHSSEPELCVIARYNRIDPHLNISILSGMMCSLLHTFVLNTQNIIFVSQLLVRVMRERCKIQNRWRKKVIEWWLISGYE